MFSDSACRLNLSKSTKIDLAIALDNEGVENAQYLAKLDLIIEGVRAQSRRYWGSQPDQRVRHECNARNLPQSPLAPLGVLVDDLAADDAAADIIYKYRKYDSYELTKILKMKYQISLTSKPAYWVLLNMLIARERQAVRGNQSLQHIGGYYRTFSAPRFHEPNWNEPPLSPAFKSQMEAEKMSARPCRSFEEPLQGCPPILSGVQLQQPRKPPPSHTTHPLPASISVSESEAENKPQTLDVRTQKEECQSVTVDSREIWADDDPGVALVYEFGKYGEQYRLWGLQKPELGLADEDAKNRSALVQAQQDTCLDVLHILLSRFEDYGIDINNEQFLDTYLLGAKVMRRQWGQLATTTSSAKPIGVSREHRIEEGVNDQQPDVARMPGQYHTSTIQANSAVDDLADELSTAYAALSIDYSDDDAVPSTDVEFVLPPMAELPTSKA